MDDSPTKEWPVADWQDQKTPADPNTPVEHRFLLRLRDNPDDLAMRMVFADWLEQIGQAEKAEIVRMFAEPRAEDAPPLIIDNRVQTEWMAIVSRAPIDKCEDDVFKFQCPKQWESLTSTDDATVRHCSTCNKAVFFCASLDEVRRNGLARRCVAFSPTLLRREALAEYDGDQPTGEYPTGEYVMMGEVDVGDWEEDMDTAVRNA